MMDTAGCCGFLLHGQSLLHMSAVVVFPGTPLTTPQHHSPHGQTEDTVDLKPGLSAVNDLYHYMGPFNLPYRQKEEESGKSILGKEHNVSKGIKMDPRRAETQFLKRPSAQWLRSTCHSRYHRGRSVALRLLRVGSRKQGLSHRLGNAGFSRAPQRPSFSPEAALFHLLFGVRALPHFARRFGSTRTSSRQEPKAPERSGRAAVWTPAETRASARPLRPRRSLPESPAPAEPRRPDAEHFLATSLSGGSPRPGSHLPSRPLAPKQRLWSRGAPPTTSPERAGMGHSDPDHSPRLRQGSWYLIPRHPGGTEASPNWEGI
ncbi:PREDICTED: uncharacterized protein LOC105548731 [Mandrillus leucophaeus]|uniref:uncharacterized protein LOC105548731 n=1 Tax=Mandrillus leucophaeus TaxID=9568 RepID=UPI0005F4320F|nr:PREDICTED: uncharacterized protein LOC105548731 [Mandrillus leucophaeus]